MKEQKRTNKTGTVSLAGAKRSMGAVSFEINPFYERLLEMRDERSSAFNSLSAVTRLAVDAYIKAKQSSSETKVRKTAA